MRHRETKNAACGPDDDLKRMRQENHSDNIRTSIEETKSDAGQQSYDLQVEDAQSGNHVTKR